MYVWDIIIIMDDKNVITNANVCKCVYVLCKKKCVCVCVCLSVYLCMYYVRHRVCVCVCVCMCVCDPIGKSHTFSFLGGPVELHGHHHLEIVRA